MSAVPAVMSLRVGGNVGSVGGAPLNAVSPVAHADPSGWLRAWLFLFHYKMEIDEAAVMEYITRSLVLVIVGPGGCCDRTTVAQYGACSVSCEVAFVCQVALLSANKLP